MLDLTVFQFTVWVLGQSLTRLKSKKVCGEEVHPVIIALGQPLSPEKPTFLVYFLLTPAIVRFSHLWVCIWLEIDKPESLTIQKALCVRVRVCVCEEGIRAAFLFILLAFSRWRSAERIHFLTCSLSLPHYWPAMGSCRKPGEFSGPDFDAERGRRCFSPRGVKAQDVWV